jgi:sodium pump decarboxylase gamma subunit
LNNVAQLVGQGLTVTLIGMTVVFVLLTLLVGVVYGMSAFARQFQTEAADELAGDELVAVIAAAIGHYRSGRA